MVRKNHCHTKGQESEGVQLSAPSGCTKAELREYDKCLASCAVRGKVRKQRASAPVPLRPPVRLTRGTDEAIVALIVP
ncbi:unnamed protein product [Toxocara canis]|uniref:Cytochrome c oxidase copper chaperone n=1 Tax=Toxocara canis TaxID=6265 RepID=A0A183V1V6_TOXCA|nr:unnamed protein product [Toxocara canis]